MTAPNGKKIPSENGSNGKDNKGRFSAGNKFGKGGDQLASTQKRLRAAIIKMVDENFLCDCANYLKDIASDTKQPATARIAAVRELFDRAVGKASQSVEVSGEIAMSVSDYFRSLAERAGSVRS